MSKFDFIAGLELADEIVEYKMIDKKTGEVLLQGEIKIHDLLPLETHMEEK